ncbi:MAG TPA: right-handed parallel beta-helix repeat-containing protein, partial [Pirellulaceae bacterium]|nr:right-handed parallel beta-helix repeat-containing protein [Pirellulaceae bacterium]
KWDTTPTGCQHIVVEANHIHHVLQKLSDGGGIYTLGRQPDSSLVNNHIHDIPVNLGRAESNGIFLDEGSSEIEVRGNVIHNLERSPIRFHKATNVTVMKNWLVSPPKVPAFRYNNAREAEMQISDNQLIEATQWQPPAGALPKELGIGELPVGSQG